MNSKKPVVVVLASQKGGVGKSSLSRALAVVAARAGLNVIVADLDPQQATVIEWAKARVAGKVARKINVGAFDSVADACAIEDCDLLIVDTPARANRETLEAAKRAHLFVQPTAGSLDDLRPAILLFHELKRAGIPGEHLMVALTRILSRNEEVAARSYVERAGYAVLPGCIREHAAYRDAQNKGRALNETEVKDLNADVDNLLAALLGFATRSAAGVVGSQVVIKNDSGGAA